MDPQARPKFEQVWAFRNRIFGLCFNKVRYLPNPQCLAEELTQNVMFQASRHLDRFRGETRLDIWLSKIARNQCASYLRKTYRRSVLLPTVSLTELLDKEDGEGHYLEFEPFLHENPEPGYIDRLQSQSTALRIRKLIDPVWYEIFEVIGEGIRQQDIATARGWTIGAFKTQLHRLREDLRKAFEIETASL